MKKQLTTAEIREQLSDDIKEVLREYWNKFDSKSIVPEASDITCDAIVDGYIEALLEELTEYPGKYPEDDAREWANNQVHIYFSDLWECAEIFSEYTEQAINEYGALDEVFQSRGLTGLFAQGELYFWEQFASEILTITNKI